MSERQSNAFIKVLQSAEERSYASCRYSNNLDKIKLLSDKEYHKQVSEVGDHIPSIADSISHLKLLKAFATLKKKITKGNSDAYAIKNWQVFVTHAVRRFIVFVTALKQYLREERTSPNDEIAIFNKGFRRNEQVISILDNLLPPLDVIMVWHAFLLNPSSFYDNCVRNDILSFATFPLPLKKISESINDVTFEYSPSKELIDGYLDVIRPISNEPNDSMYDFESFSMFEGLVSIACPICKEFMVKDVPYTNDTKTGFADESFAQLKNCKDCKCDFAELITHEELRKRQLYSDVKKAVPMAGLYVYFSGRISGRDVRSRRDPQITNGVVKSKFIRHAIDDMKNKTLEESIRASLKLKQHSIPLTLILRLYFSMNLVYVTVPKGVAIWEDLVGCVLRQERFVEKMEDLNWLYNVNIRETLAEATLRYSRFFKMLTVFYPGKVLVPTLDIDLIWHTHQLSLNYYFVDCLNSKLGAVVDHDDKIESTKLDYSFEETTKLYKWKFKKEYCVCYCAYCLAVKGSVKTKLTGIFNSNSKTPNNSDVMDVKATPSFVNSVGLTHISIHNAIVIPNTFAEKRQELLMTKYNERKVDELPWQEGQANSYNHYPHLFVVPPLSPVGIGLCQAYYGSTCTGISDISSFAGNADAATNGRGCRGLIRNGIQTGVLRSGLFSI
ncbi:uncharacterized protein RJT20DRAFT_114352 [Scheffersomyces xylosifermentans]|uniref:uncharacterized protein n=1 Tax=Scheffersomyces xylosifermentans TaxID=1304137 RepID=UPI00315D867D